MLRERHLGGTIILADAHIRYSKPISGKPHAVADLGALSGDLDRLARGRKARVQMQVEIFGDETPGAVFVRHVYRSAASHWPSERRERRRVADGEGRCCLSHSFRSFTSAPDYFGYIE